MRRSLIAAPVDGNVPSSEEEEEEKLILRERISSRDTALYGYVAPQLRSFAALGGLGALWLPAAARPPAA